MMQSSFATDCGPRENLEDTGQTLSLVLNGRSRAALHCLTLFDGVGGNNSGEVASATAKASISASLAMFIAGHDELGASASTPEMALDALVQALEDANDEIVRQAASDRALEGMSTTAVCAIVTGDILAVAWAGDSRCYLARGSTIRCLTRDDTAVRDLIDFGLITREEAAHHPRAHVITRWLGQTEGFAVSTSLVRLQVGDVIVLCSDGLTDVVSDAQIVEQVVAHRDDGLSFDELARRLVRLALERGTTDNVTVLCGHYQTHTSSQVLAFDHTLTEGYTLEAVSVLEHQRKEIHDELLT